MSLMNATINGRIYDVVTEEEYIKNRNLYQSQYGFVAVLRDNGTIYPVKSKYDDSPGMYDSDQILYFTDPRKDDKNIDQYSKDNLIDFSKATDYRGVIEAKQKMTSAERFILTTVDDVFKPEIGPNDAPEMVALKQVIGDKKIDIDKYEARFGPNFNNDKRLLKKEGITFGKLRTICNALDIKATITFEDKNPEVPNPIGRVVTTEITNNINMDGGDDE